MSDFTNTATSSDNILGDVDGTISFASEPAVPITFISSPYVFYGNHVAVCKLSENATIPTRGSVFSAGWDFYSPVDCVVPAGDSKLIMTDIAMGWDERDVYLQLCSRSSLAYKSGVTVEAGVSDMDYRKNIGCLLFNFSPEDFVVSKGDRICQGIFQRYKNDTLFEVGSVANFHEIETTRIGGFGSTGI